MDPGKSHLIPPVFMGQIIPVSSFGDFPAFKYGYRYISFIFNIGRVGEDPQIFFLWKAVQFLTNTLIMEF